jgi:hypothetical protein
LHGFPAIKLVGCRWRSTRLFSAQLLVGQPPSFQAFRLPACS